VAVVKPADGTGESLARAFGRDASSLADGFSLMSPEVKVRTLCIALLWGPRGG